MNVLSCFDGMSCAQIALRRSGLPITRYYASEIDKYAMQVTMANYPNTVQLGSVTEWNSWDLPKIDILMGGSPCQSFSFCGKQEGMSTKCKKEITTLGQYQLLKSEGFEFQGQSYLFWEYIAVLRHYKPKYFLLENVKMAKKWQDLITATIGVDPLQINSSLVSAQNRKRLYWTNIPDIKQPPDKGILLKDIIENFVDNAPLAVIKNRGELQDRSEKAMCLDANYHKGVDNHGQRTQIVLKPCALIEKKTHGQCHHVATTLDINVQDHMKRVYAGSGKSPTLNTCSGGNREIKLLNTPMAFTEVRTEKAKQIRRDYKRIFGEDFSPRREKQLFTRTDNKMNCLTNSFSEKEHTILDNQCTYRKLTPLECERLQTVPEQFTNHVSNSRRYQMLGNMWTIDAIVHMLNNIKDKKWSLLR